jgi:hypothetical protein
MILFVTIILLAVSGAHAQQRKAAPSSRYMGGPVELVTAPNGAIINKEVLEELPKTAWTNGPEIENPVEGVYVLGGYLISACIVVEADDGLIVFDTGDTKHDGEKLLEAIRTFSNKPIKAFVYLHSHYVFGTGVMAEGNKDVMVIAHPDMDKVVAQNMGSGGAPAYFPEIGPVLTARALLQFNVYLPKEGPDAWYSPTNLNLGEVAYLPVTHPVKDGEILDVLGEKMQFFTKYGTDDKVHTTVWFPERKIVVENMLWATPPNMYSTRGDLFRVSRGESRARSQARGAGGCCAPTHHRQREDSKYIERLYGRHFFCARPDTPGHLGRLRPGGSAAHGADAGLPCRGSP